MKKFILSFFVVVASAGYVLSQYINSSSVVANNGANIEQTQTNTQSTSAPLATSQPTPTPTPTSVPAVTPAPKGQYIDGVYTGPAVDAFYGNIQVKATIQNGKLVDVAFLQYPNDRNTSRMINDQATPLLRQEAIQAQSASVDIVSGATQSSEAFQQSLGAVLTQAKS